MTASLCWVLISALPATAAAEMTTIGMKVRPQKLVMGDTVTVEVTIRGEFDDIQPPSSEGFVFRQAGRSSQVSIVGSRITRSLVLTFRGTPKRTGAWPIRPAQALLKGRVVASGAPVNVEVKDARAALGAALDPTEASDLQQFRDEPFFVRPVLSTPAPYVGQPVVAQYELYWAAGASVQGIQESAQANFANLNTQDLIKGDPAPQQRVRVNGAIYFRQITRKVLLTATSPGVYELMGPSYRVEVGDFFDTRRYKLHPPVVKLTVRALPAQGKPKSYQQDAVGQYQLGAQLSRRGQKAANLQAATGERVVLTYEIRGRGNLQDLSPLKPADSDTLSFEPLPGKGDERIEFSDQGPQGIRRWQYLVSARSAGRHTIPPLSLTVFDPLRSRYYTLTTPQLVIEAKGGAADSKVAQTAPNGSPQQDQVSAPKTPVVSPKGSAGLRLRPIASQSSIATGTPTHWTDSLWFWPAACFGWLSLLLMIVLNHFRSRWNAGAQERDKVSALSNATAALEQATDIVALHQIARDFLRIRLELQVIGLTSDAVHQALIAKGIGKAVSATLCEGLSACEHARFVPGAGAEQLDMLRKTLLATFVSIDADLQRPQTRVAQSLSTLIIAGLLMAPPLPGHANSLEASFSKANQLQLSARYVEAIEVYEALLQHGVDTAAIHYNLGTAYANNNELGKALGHYRRAERLQPPLDLVADLLHNTAQVRNRLSSRARRNHRVLHIFDETPELHIAIANAAPRDLLGVTVLALGLMLALFGWLVWRQQIAIWVVVALVVTQAAGALWLWHSQNVSAQLRPGVVIEEDAPLAPCKGVADSLQLPEGLEVQILKVRPDGRVEVRLRNGRHGCLRPEAIYEG